MNDHQMHRLQPLIGKEVTLSVKDDMVTIYSRDGWELHIYNSFSLTGDGFLKKPTDAPLSLVLLSFRFDRGELALQFSGDVTLTVDLSDDGYTGPEAMQLNGPDGKIIIWN
jgi:hypothetical protein